MKYYKKVFYIEWNETDKSEMTIDAITLERILDCNVTGCCNIKIKERRVVDKKKKV
jgi:hypothetical protein